MTVSVSEGFRNVSGNGSCPPQNKGSPQADAVGWAAGNINPASGDRGSGGMGLKSKGPSTVGKEAGFREREKAGR